MKPVDEELELARLLAAEASPLGASLGALRERGPDASELGLLASRLSLRGIDVTEPPKAAPAAPKAPKKWLIPGAGGAALGVLWLALRGSTPAPVQDTDAEARARAHEVQKSHAAPEGPADARGSGSVPGAPRSDAAIAAPADAPVPSEAAAPAERARAETPAPDGKDARPSTDAPSADSASRSGARTPGASATTAPVPSSAPGAPTEIELLRDARLALRQSPGAALAFAEQHARLYPQGKLTQERELIAISALVASGRRTAALSRGARFEQAFPTSPYRKQLGELLK